MSMVSEKEVDPRVRRTRQLLQNALMSLLQEKSFAELSVTDITKRAEVARVTFYQHYASKEALLLTLVADFFAQMYGMLDTAVVQQWLTSGQSAIDIEALPPLDPAQMQLIRVALEYTNTAVRELAINSFTQAFAQSTLFTNPNEAQFVATYHVSGMLALLETYLLGDLPISAPAFQRGTLLLLRLLLQDGVATGMLVQALQETG
jgi:AcrR family transcriptional regulator